MDSGRPTPERLTALKALDSIMDRGAYSNLELDGLLDAAPRVHGHPPFVTELVNGTVRRARTLDFVIAVSTGRPLEKLHPTVVNILRIGLYQMLFMDGVPDHVAVNESVLLAHARGLSKASGLVNGCLRGLLRRMATVADDAGFPGTSLTRKAATALLACGGREAMTELPHGGLGLLESHPDWLVRDWVRRFGPEGASLLCAANNRSPSVHIRTNLTRVSRESLMATLREGGVSCAEGALAPECIRCHGLQSMGDSEPFRKGLYQVQDEGAMAVTRLLSPSRGSKVLDVCAAPGGKATHCAEIMGNEGWVAAVDSNGTRLKLVGENAARLGLGIIEAIEADARDMAKRFEPGTFDFVLVDAPCSGTGVLCRKPDIRWKRREGDMASLIPLQRDILAASVPLLKPGGVLVYATCSLQWEENEGNAEWLSQRFPELVPNGEGEYFLPHVHGTDGFFAAGFTRVSG